MTRAQRKAHKSHLRKRGFYPMKSPKGRGPFGSRVRKPSKDYTKKKQ